MKLRTLALLCLAVIIGITGCGGKKQDNTVDLSEVPPMTENTLPISEKGVELSIWMVNNAQGYVNNYNDMKAFDILKERTGVGFSFQHPTGDATEQLNIMLASNDYPDMIMTAPEPKYLKDGVAIRLNEYIDVYAPNFKKLMTDDPEAYNQIPLASGDIIGFPMITDDEHFLCYDGYFIRKDWLDAVGMDIPETMDDWYNVLCAFRDKNPGGNEGTVPFSTFGWMFPSSFNAAYGVKTDYIVNPKTGKMTHGVIEPAFRDYLAEMSKWYKEGLLDENLLNVSGKDLDALMLNDKLGAIMCDNNNSIPKYQQLRPDIDLVPLPVPKGPDGKAYYPENANIRRVRGSAGIITSACKNIVEAVRVCDYLYSEEGKTLFNWGVEGESFSVNADGTKQFTDNILKNPQGKIPHEAICEYITNTGFIGFNEYAAARGLEANLPEIAKKTRDQSIEYTMQSDKSMLYQIIPFSIEEKAKLNDLNTDMKTLIKETVDKIIIGVEPIEKYDELVKQVKAMSIDDAIAIHQTAYDRLKNR